MVLNTLLLSFAFVLILRALRVRVIFGRIPFPPEKPPGLFGWHATLVHVPKGVGFGQRAMVAKIDGPKPDKRLH